MKNSRKCVKRHFTSIIMVVLTTILLPTNSHAQKLDSDLRKAAKNGETEKVQNYLEKGASINSSDNKGKTALMLAAEEGHEDVVKLLLKGAADISAIDNTGESALDKARRKNRTKVVEILEFAQAQSKNTIEAYEDFLRHYPNGSFTIEARSGMEKLYFNQAQSKNTIETYDDFLKRYPNGSLTTEAWVRIEKLYFDQAQSKNTIDAYEDFIRRFPKGNLSAKAQSRLDKLYPQIKNAFLLTWDKLSKCDIIRNRNLNNKIKVRFGWAGNRPAYVLSPLDEDGQIESSGIIEELPERGITLNYSQNSKFLVMNGYLIDNRPDGKFFSVLGIGTYLLLLDSNEWIDICGIMFKGGAIKIVKEGFEFQAGTILRRPVEQIKD